SEDSIRLRPRRQKGDLAGPPLRCRRGNSGLARSCSIGTTADRRGPWYGCGHDGHSRWAWSLVPLHGHGPGVLTDPSEHVDAQLGSGAEEGAKVPAALAHRSGPASSVVDVARVEPEPLTGDDAVRLRMLASTVNPSDLVMISGAHASRTRYPFVPGFEGIGEVVETDPGAPSRLLGRRVLTLGSAENWQEYKVTSARWCFEVPETLTTEEACFVYTNPLSALLMVDEHARPGIRVAVVNGATSAIGGTSAC